MTELLETIMEFSLYALVLTMVWAVIMLIGFIIFSLIKEALDD